jgi:hypothetical protein
MHSAREAIPLELVVSVALAFRKDLAMKVGVQTYSLNSLERPQAAA